jgi:hypothetical protein
MLGPIEPVWLLTPIMNDKSAAPARCFAVPRGQTCIRQTQPTSLKIQSSVTGWFGLSSSTSPTGALLGPLRWVIGKLLKRSLQWLDK